MVAHAAGPCAHAAYLVPRVCTFGHVGGGEGLRYFVPGGCNRGEGSPIRGALFCPWACRLSCCVSGSWPSGLIS